MALTDEQLEIISDALVPLFQHLEQEVIVDIARRIKKTLTYSRTAELQAMAMKEMGYSPAKIRKEAMKILNADPEFRKMVAKNTLEYKREVRSIIHEITKEAYKANDAIVANAGNMSWINDLEVWKSSGKALTSNSFLPQLIEAFSTQTAGELKNLTQTTGFKTMSGYESIENTYKREMDKAIIKICSGTFDQDKVLRDVVHDLAQSGLRSIDYASGYSMQLDTAARVAIRTGCHQLAAKVTDKNIKETGENLVYVSKHWGARNTGAGHANHEQWQGQVYFIKDGIDYSEEAKRIGQNRIMSLWYATGYSVDGSRENDPLGLNGYNCRHNHFPWFEGVSSLPKETPEPDPVTINGKTYDYYAITQKMRSMERGIRALKRERQAQDRLGIDSTGTKVKVSQKIQEYKAFCQRCNIREASNRLRVDSGSSDITKTQAYKMYRKEYFKSQLKAKTLGASDAVGDGSEPVCIGQIDVTKTKEAVEYFGEQIRNSDIEELYIIDKSGNVYYNRGVEDSVSIGSLDLTDCTVLHNHPRINGIVSFGEDDFMAIRDNGVADWYLVNEQYDYYARRIKPMDGVTYNQAWHWYYEEIEQYGITGEMQHMIMESLERRGYIQYGRKKANTRPKR